MARSLHSTFCKVARRDVPFTMTRLNCWTVWRSFGWTADDLVLVINHIHNLIRQRRRWDQSLRFEKVVEDAERFGEDLAEARALLRASKPHLAHRELTATGRPAVVERDTTRSAAQILAGEEAFKQFQNLKNTL